MQALLITKPFPSSSSFGIMQPSAFLPKPCISSSSFVKLAAKPTVSSSYYGKIQALPFVTKPLLPSSSLLPVTSFSSPFLPIRSSRNDQVQTREKSELQTLQKKIHKEVLKNNMDKAILVYDEWKAKRVPLFEDWKTSREIVGMSKGAFVTYLWEKFFGKPSEREEKNKIGGKKKMKIKKPKQKFVKKKKVGFPVKRKKVVNCEKVSLLITIKF